MTRPAPATIDLMTLRLLLAVAAEGNLARAAARENIALSAASRRISNLEGRLGVRLLHRHDRGTTPTAAAQAILPRVQAMFDLLDQILDDLGDVRDGRRGLVRIRAHTTAMAGALPERIAAFIERHPLIDVTVDESTSAEIAHSVSTGGCDLGLIAETVTAADLTLTPWLQDELVALLPPGHPLEARPAVRLADLLPFPFICMQRDSMLVAQFRREAQSIGSGLIERAHVSSFDVACRMVANGLGVTIMPRDAIPASGRARMRLAPLDEGWARRSLLICTRDPARQSIAVRLFLAFLLDTAPDGGAGQG